jgi:hypothetical protein
MEILPRVRKDAKLTIASNGRVRLKLPFDMPDAEQQRIIVLAELVAAEMMPVERSARGNFRPGGLRLYSDSKNLIRNFTTDDLENMLLSATRAIA